MSRPDAGQIEALNRVAKEASRTAAARSGSITELARRHGWTVKEEQAEYFGDIDVRISKDGRHADLWLMGHNRRFSHGHTHNGSAYIRTRDLQRMERFIIGVACTCTSNKDDMSWADTPSPTCEVHG